MDTYSSGEDLLIKTRKPYTITKQRERWTEEEHNRFLEALKLYGRAWQRIEEHIGTKTAVQIRSHAQKFFSKLEKEAVAKGVPIGKAIDIDIPPPRPKRKPSNPYPRKTGVSPITSHAGTKDGNLSPSLPFPCSQQVLDLEKEPPSEKPSGDENSTGAKETHDESCSELFNCSSSASFLKKKSTPPPEVLRRIPSSFREFVPCLKDAAASQDATNESHSHITSEHHDGNRKCYTNNNKSEHKLKVQDNGSSSKVLQLGKSCHHLHEESLQGKKANDGNNAIVMLPEDKILQQHYPRHVPVHILDGRSLGTCHDSMTTTVGESSQARSDVYSLQTPSAAEVQNNMLPTSLTHESFPPFPFTPVLPHSHQDDYRSFLQISSTFSSLIMSTLLQNPAAHAAASFAASFWPYANVENGADSSRQVVNSAPSMAAIAGATVAAATAWWAAHGLLPLCAPPPPPPMHGASFACPPPAAIPSPHAGSLNMGSKEGTPLEHSRSEAAVHAQNSTSKSPAMSSSGTGEENNGGSNLNAAAPQVADHKMHSTAPEVNNDSSEPKNRKQVDRSSCGSNTASSSEVETDALEKNEKDKEEATKEGADADNQPASTTDSGCRRSRSNTSTSGDSWKSVSEEGRLAFQALFSREVLPQSFSPPPDGEVEMPKNVEHRNEEVMMLDLNRCHLRQETNVTTQPTHEEECLLPTIGIVGNGKLKSRRTGFKPYKRCSLEVKENRLASGGGQGEEKESKRICLGLEGEASI